MPASGYRDVADAAVRSALVAVALAMRTAVDPWWIIGSAAVVLHGAVTDVADIDLLVGERDAAALATRHGLSVMRPDGDAKFRSRLFLRWARADRDVEIMAGLMIADAAGWSPVLPETRVTVDVAGERLFVPDRAELMAILTRFDRPKDHARRRLLVKEG